MDSRRRKAEKIVALLRAWTSVSGASVLEVGTGSGVIAAVLAEAVGPEGTVTGVDVRDLRVLHEGFAFEQVRGTELPFPENAFDIVVSNHVVEHVGGRAAQRDHLSEVGRVLAPDGLCYLATPNRWSPIEPHFDLPLLSWLPVRWRTPYVRLARRGDVYDIEPVDLGELVPLLHQAGLTATPRVADAMRVIAEHPSTHRAKRVAIRCGAPLLGAIPAAAPTLIVEARPTKFPPGAP